MIQTQPPCNSVEGLTHLCTPRFTPSEWHDDDTCELLPGELVIDSEDTALEDIFEYINDHGRALRPCIDLDSQVSVAMLTINGYSRDMLSYEISKKHSRPGYCEPYGGDRDFELNPILPVVNMMSSGSLHKLKRQPLSLVILYDMTVEDLKAESRTWLTRTVGRWGCHVLTVKKKEFMGGCKKI